MFNRLLFSYTVNSVGDYVGLYALTILIWNKTGDPLASTALFLAAQFLPALFAPGLTAAIDQRPPRLVLAVIYAAEAVIFSLQALVAILWFSLPTILVLTFLDGVLMLTARAISRGTVNAVVSKEGLLREGNGLLNVGFAGASIGGTTLGGILVELFSVQAALFADAVSFAIVALVIASSRGLPTPTGAGESLMTRARAGLHYVRTNPIARIMVGGEGVAVIFFTMIVPVEVVYADQVLNTNEFGYGLLLSFWGAGIVLGSLIYLTIRRHSVRTLILCSTLAIGIAYLGMTLVDRLALACAISVVGGIGNGIQWVSVMTALQEVTPADLQARITGLLESVTAAMTGVGFAVGGIITTLTGPLVTFTIAGGAVVLIVIAAAAFNLVPNIKPQPPAR